MLKVTNERAVRRYLQIRAIEETVGKIEASILQVQKEINDADDRLKSLRKQKAELLETMREAAKDKGQLPLFDNLTDQLAELGVPAELLPIDPAFGEARH